MNRSRLLFFVGIAVGYWAVPWAVRFATDKVRGT